MLRSISVKNPRYYISSQVKDSVLAESHTHEGDLLERERRKKYSRNNKREVLQIGISSQNIFQVSILVAAGGGVFRIEPCSLFTTM